METKSRHVLAEYFGCDRTALGDEKLLMAFLLEAAAKAKATPVRELHHQNENGSLTVMLIVSESHFALHSWPKQGYVSADFYTCGTTDPDAAAAFMGKKLLATGMEIMTINRGIDAATTGELLLVSGRSMSGSVYEDDTDPG